jgi:cytochrome c556
MVSRPLLLTLLAGVASATLALAHEGHEGATGVVKERQDLMETQKDAMKVMGDMARGKVPFDAGAATKAANEIGSTAKKIPDLFPEGSGGEANKSDALPAIWEKWERFKANADDLASASDALAKALGDSAGAEWKPAFQKVGEACKSCHEDFRKKDEE